MSINKTVLMHKAWAYAKEIIGDLAARLSYGLKRAWAEMNPKTVVSKKLVELGAKAWVHPVTGAVRIYLNRAVHTLLKIDVEYHKTGSLSFFAMDGFHYSNTAGRRYLASFARAWWDGEQVRDCTSPYITECLEEAIKEL